MQARARCAVLVALLVTTLVAAADLPHAGKWKLNPSKSDFGELTATYELTQAGEIKADFDGMSFVVKPDGKDYPTPWGTTTSWKAVDATTWQTNEKVGDQVTSTSSMKLSADDKTLTIDTKMMKADGGSSDDSMVFRRVSGGPGLSGKWKAKNMTSSAPMIMELAPEGPDGLTLKYVDQGGVCVAKFDGKDHPATGAMWPAGWTCSIAKSGANGLELSWKKDGKLMYKSALTVSDDGKTLSERGGAVTSAEKVKVVYDRI